MSFQEAVKSVLGKYADFSGRASRSEYWFWYLAILLGYVVYFVLVTVSFELGLVYLIALVLAVFVPTLAVGVRRLHDIGKSGWLTLLGLIPFVGIILLVFALMDSTPGANAYGPNPKDVTGATGTGGYGPPPTV